jgi:hypothetical protein
VAASSAVSAQAPIPPASAEQDMSAYNNRQVGAFVSTDPGWRAWLNAFQASEQADNAILDTSTFNTPVVQLVQAVTVAQDAYRSATSFYLPPFSVTSSCRQGYAETNGLVRLSDGLLVRYSYQYSLDHRFENGSSCRMGVGSIDEVDSSRGLPIVTVKPPGERDSGRSPSALLVWNTPFAEISRNNTWSLPDLVELIETGKPPRAVQSPAQCILF